MPEQGRASRGSLGLLLLGFLMLNSALFTEIALYSRNTAEHHPEWFLGKLIPQKQPFCVWDCVRTRNLMARNRLNLAAWHGFQEVFLNRVGPFSRVRFRYRLQKEAYLDVILSLTPQGYTGVRLGQSECFAFTAAPTGEFTSRTPLALKDSGGPRWHTCEVTPGKLVLDGSACAIPPGEAGLFGFRGSLANAEVDDVEVWADDRLLVRDNFRNDRHWRAVALWCTGLLTVVTGLLLLLPGGPRKLLWLLLGHVTLLGFLLLYLFVDYSIWSARYAENEPPEKARIAFFSALEGADPVREQSLAQVRTFLGVQQPPKSEYRLQVYRPDGTYAVKETPEGLEAFRRSHPKRLKTVLFLGCSQNGGEGSLKLEDGMIPVAQRQLGCEVVSASRQGTNSSELMPRYFTLLNRFRPDLVVAYLGSNDGDAELLAANLHRLAAWNKRAGVKTLIIMEANSPENPFTNPPFLMKKHAAMREVGKLQGVPALDLNAELAKAAGSGFLWWDEVHMTSYGHKLSGDFLAAAIRSIWQGAREPE